MTGLVKNFKTVYNIQVQYLCYNNAGEDIAFRKACKQEGMGMDFVFNTHDTPQQKAVLNGNLQPSSFRYVVCSTVGNSPLF